MVQTLTPGACSQIYNGDQPTKPVLQVINVKSLQTKAQAASAKRYRLIISDGDHYQQAMLATQLNQQVDDGQIKDNCLVQIDNFILNEVQNRKIVIVLGLEVVGQAAEKIGNPQNVEKGGQAKQPQEQPPSQLQQQQPPQQQQQPPPPQQQHQQQQNFYQQQSNPYQQQQQQQQPARQLFQQQQNPYSDNSNSNSNGRSNHSANNNPYTNKQSSGPVGRVDHAPNVVPISSLNPYQNRWCIKARVTKKGDIRRWENARGSGTLFSIDLLDAHGGEIRATFFKEACEKFHTMLQEEGVYYFSGGKLKVANKQYSNLNNNYEVTFDLHSEIRPAGEDNSIKKQIYAFKKINELQQCQNKECVDIVAIVSTVGDLTPITSKAGHELVKREITLVDHSNAEVRMTLWGAMASQNEQQWENNPVVAFKGAPVSDYGGRTLGTYRSTSVEVNPDVPEAHELRAWWDQGGSTQQVQSLTNAGGGNSGGGMGTFEERKTLNAIKDEGLGNNNAGNGEFKKDYFTVKATINYIKHDQQNVQGGPWYYACPDEAYKVIQDPNGEWRCERNNKTYQTKRNRWILPLTVNDYTGNSWCTAFDETAMAILNGVTADEAEEIKNQSDDKYEAIYAKANFQTFLFRMVAKAEMVQDELRTKVTALKIEKLNYATECRALIDAIEKAV